MFDRGKLFEIEHQSNHKCKAVARLEDVQTLTCLGLSEGLKLYKSMDWFIYYKGLRQERVRHAREIALLFLGMNNTSLSQRAICIFTGFFFRFRVYESQHPKNLVKF